MFFDDLKVTHTETLIKSFTDYYPFGYQISGLSGEAAGTNPNKIKFQGQELQDDFGLGWYQFKWRMHDPSIGRFTSVDPLAENYVHNSTYAFSENKVTAHVELEGLESWYAADGNVVNGPFSRKTVEQNGLRAVQGVAAHGAYTGIQSQKVRAEYRGTVANLDPTDSRARTQAKIDARERTPAIPRNKIEKMRPMEGEGARTGGTANKSNAGVNSQAEVIGKIGKGAAILSGGISVYNIAVAEDKGNAVVVEGAATTNAVILGELGAELGGAIGNFPGAIIGGVVGATIGSIVGGEVATGASQSQPSSQPVDPHGRPLNESDATRVQIIKPELK